MKVYILVEVSNGEIPLEIDRVKIFKTKDEAIEALEKSYKEKLNWAKNCEDLVSAKQKELYYEIEFYDDCGTRYIGQIEVGEI